MSKWRMSSWLLDIHIESSDERVHLRATGTKTVHEGMIQNEIT